MSLAALHNHTDTNQASLSIPQTLREAIGLALRLAGSLWVTVTVFSLALVLVFFGTLAQVELGIWTVVEKYFRSAGIIWLPLRLLAYVPGLDSIAALRNVRLSLPFPGGWLLGWALLINFLAALFVQFRLGWKWLGVWILHIGVITLMFGELLTGLLAIEANMVMQVGERCNYLEHSQRWEIAFVRADRTDADETVVIPHRFWLHPNLQEPVRITHPDLPADVEILNAWKNSIVNPLQEDEEDASGSPFLVRTKGGQLIRIEGTAETPGINPSDDMPAVHLRLLHKQTGTPISECVLSLWMDRNGNRRMLQFAPVLVSIGEHVYELTLRRERIYLPFTFELRKFVHTTYPGTSVPKEFRSDIRLYDQSNTEGRDVTITMNQPLSYEGLTFYQSGYLPDDSGTILQVVRNPGRWLPYIGCLLVAMGMLAHFTLHLVGFLQRSRAGFAATAGRSSPSTAVAVAPYKSKTQRISRRQPADRNSTENTELKLLRALPWLAGGIAFVYLVMPWFPTGSTQGFEVHEFGALPVLQARLKPWDTVARTSLMAISGKQTFTDNQGRSQPAIIFLLDVIANRPQAEHHRIFRIDNDEVLSLLRLQRRPGNRYALAEFRDRLDALLAKMSEANRKPKDEQTVFERQVLKLGNQLLLYQRLARLDDPELRRSFDLGDEIRPIAPESGREADWQSYWSARLQMEQALHQFLASLPREEVEAARRDRKLLDRLAEKYAPQLRSVMEQVQAGGYRHFEAILDAWRKQDPREFNEAVRDYRKYLEQTQPGNVLRKVTIEAAFNRSETFYHAAVMYGLMFVLACLGFLLYYFGAAWPQRVQQAVFGALVATVLAHTFGLLIRMYLHGRPPVTNLYSSAIFIGWAGAALGVVLERIYRLGIGNAAAAALGGTSLIIAHHLATDDTLGVLQAVLDTNFWLATHVTCITLGYTATFLAGVIAIAFVLAGLWTKALAQQNVLRTMYGMMYGITCFAILFSFTGTVLGGLWADVSWGRFWGWDPKENGALLIVLVNALALHARWGGIVKQRGFALLCILGNIVTAWSWFGTNQMGIGLHSYGRMEGATLWLSIFWLSQIALIGIGLLPLRLWRSFHSAPSTS